MFLFEFTPWWDALGSLEKVYWIIALPSTIVFFFLLVSTFIGGDIDSDIPDADMQIDLDDGIGFAFFTFKNLVGFFTIFSWVGLGCIRGGLSMGTTLIVSFICGLLMMTVMALIFYGMSRLVEDGTLKMKNAIGRLGEVYLPVPKESGGFGKITLNIQGSYREMDAMTKDTEDLKVGSVVKVLEVIDGHILLVTKNNA